MSDLGLYMPQPRTRLREADKGGPGWCLPNRSCMALLVVTEDFQGFEVCKHMDEDLTQDEFESHDLYLIDID